MKPEWQRRIRYGGILLSILLISILHYATSTDYRILHEIYQRIYYIPIILAAFAYGPVGGIAASLLATILYAIHIKRDWSALPVYSFNQYAEILVFNVIALVVGLLSRREKRQRRQLERTSAELVEAYDRLQKAFEKLKRADRMAALGQISAGIAHEIRNPLGSIKGSVEILDPEIPPDHPKREFVAIIKEETARLNAIVNEVLKFARPLKPSVEPVSINELIESTLILFRKQAEYSKVELSTSLNQKLPTMRLDPSQMRQVLLNVILNAAQAMKEGGRLTITSGIGENDSVAIEISDTGSGIEDENLDRIFDPFFTTKTQGTGLGLSISHQLVANHGGTITARNNPDRGVTIRIEIPIASTLDSASENPSISGSSQ